MNIPSAAHLSRAAVGATAVLAVTAFLPWTRSGQVSRSGWSTVSSARKLGVVDSLPAELVVSAFYLVPAFACLALVVHVLDRHRAAAAIAAAAAVATVVIAVAVIRSPLGVRWGLWLNIAIAAIDGVLAIALVARTRRPGSPSG